MAPQANFLGLKRQQREANSASYVVISNIESKALELLLRIWEVPGSNLGPDRAILTEVFRGILYFSRQIAGEYVKVFYNRFLPHPFQFIIHHFIHRYVV
jgi:hypothetical protein